MEEKVEGDLTGSWDRIFEEGSRVYPCEGKKNINGEKDIWDRNKFYSRFGGRGRCNHPTVGCHVLCNYRTFKIIEKPRWTVINVA